MKTKILILCAVLTFATWATAQMTMGAQQNTQDNVRVTSGPNVTTTSNAATIRWKTDDLASTNIMYGTDPNNMSQTQKHSGGARDHNVQLTGLQPGTTYYFAIMTNDGDVRQQGSFTTKGTSSASTTNNTSYGTTATQSGTMTTSGATDNIQITMGPEIRNFNGSSATLYWQTDKTAANEVHYSTDPNNLSQHAFEPGGSREHSIQLTDLQPGQTYYFEILRRNGSVREPGSFTLPTTATATTTSATGTYPAIPVQMGNGTAATTTGGGAIPVTGGTATGAVQITSGPTVETVSDTQAVVSWTTNQASSSTVRFGQSWLALNQQAQAAWSTQHRVTISGLKPNTKYYFRVESAAAQGTSQVARSQFGTFQTGAPGQAAQAPRR